MPSLLEALERKYFSDCQIDNLNDEDSSSNGAEIISIFIPRLSPLLLVPELLVLNDCDIDCAGNFESIKEKCQRVRELDLAQNKLQDWQEVFHILKHMPRIEFLNLSKNYLNGPITKLFAPSINNLKAIVLNGTYLDWLCIDVLLENLPILEELHLSLNNYKEVLIDTHNAADKQTTTTTTTTTATATNNATQGTIDAENTENSDTNNEIDTNNKNSGNNEKCQTNDCCNCNSNMLQNPSANNCENCNCKSSGNCKTITAHKALKTLHFTGNPIESWQEICRLGRVFPNLENLVLADCPIKAILVTNTNNSNGTTTQESEEMPSENFQNLVLLNLSCANIETWEDIDRLAKFPKLRNLRLKHWPLWDRLECTEHERRQLQIARLPNVGLLNGGGLITADEREDAERYFIRYYMEKNEWERPQRYNELIAKHGKLDPLVNINLKPDKRVKIFLTYKDKREARLVDIYRTVFDLKVKLEKVVGLPANKMRLYYLDQDYKEFGPEEMRYPNKLLYSYNIQNGDEIIIDQKK